MLFCKYKGKCVVIGFYDALCCVCHKMTCTQHEPVFNIGGTFVSFLFHHCDVVDLVFLCRTYSLRLQ